MSEAAEKTSEHTSSLETVDEVTRKATVSIPAEKVDREFGLALERVQKSAKIKGFRPGKAPKDMIERMHGPRLRFEVANDLISSSLQEIIKGIEETVVGSPEIDLTTFEPGKELEFTANISIFPNPKVVDPGSYAVTVQRREVSDKMVQDVLENLLSSKAEHELIEDRKIAEKGDVIEATVEVAEPGAEPQTEPLVVELGSGQLPDELENGIIGMEVGSNKDIEIKHEADSGCDGHAEAHSHKFSVTLNALKKKILPELTDEFTKNLNFPGIETALELKTDIRKRLEEEQEQLGQEDLNTEILKLLLEANKDFLLPKVLIDDEIRSLAVQNRRIDPEKAKSEDFDIEPFREAFAEIAEKRVRMTIIIDRFADQNDMKADEKDIDAHCAIVAAKHGMPEKEVKEFLTDRSRIVGTLLEVTRDKVLQALREKADISYKEEKEE